MATDTNGFRDRVKEVRRVRADQIVNAPWNYRSGGEHFRRK